MLWKVAVNICIILQNSDCSRWDSPQHVLTDDGPDQIWPGWSISSSEFFAHLLPGKDYSNPRSRDFYDLHKPFDEMHDRSKVPRMPWFVGSRTVLSYTDL